MYHKFMKYHPTLKVGFKQTNNNKIRIELSSIHARAQFNGEKLAESGCALFLYEAGHEPVLYYPREDVCMKRLELVLHKFYL